MKTNRKIKNQKMNQKIKNQNEPNRKIRYFDEMRDSRKARRYLLFWKL